jgi:N-dimethylarginine dimethylaminohydrolase
MNKVLLCKPTHYDVTYEINPWMRPGTVNKVLAFKQWEELLKAYRDIGVEVITVEQNSKCPDMVFATDQAAVNNGVALMANFKYPERKLETNFYAEYLKDLGYEIRYMPKEVYFEGGDILRKDKDTYLLGHGFRTDRRAGRHISEILKCNVIPLKLTEEYFYHLDTCLFVLNSDTVFYYPEAFSEESKEAIENNFSECVTISRKQASTFCFNSIILNNKVICQKGAEQFAKKINDKEKEFMIIDVSEFNKSGGGIHCLTLKL